MKIDPLLAPDALGPRLDALKETKSTESSFGAQLESILEDVESKQLDAREQSIKAAAGEASLHDVALALEKADISIRLLSKGREKVVNAYQEIMRMQV